MVIWKIMKYGKIYEIKNKGLPYFNDNDELVFGSLFVCVRTNRKELASLNGMLTKIVYHKIQQNNLIGVCSRRWITLTNYIGFF